MSSGRGRGDRSPPPPIRRAPQQLLPMNNRMGRGAQPLMGRARDERYGGGGGGRGNARSRSPRDRRSPPPLTRRHHQPSSPPPRRRPASPLPIRHGSTHSASFTPMPTSMTMSNRRRESGGSERRAAEIPSLLDLKTVQPPPQPIQQSGSRAESYSRRRRTPSPSPSRSMGSRADRRRSPSPRGGKGTLYFAKGELLTSKPTSSKMVERDGERGRGGRDEGGRREGMSSSKEPRRSDWQRRN